MKRISIFLDLSKAFYCIDHNNLPDKLNCIGVCSLSFNNWIRCYLNTRKQQIEVNNVL